MVASKTRKTSYPARLISPIASAMRSESERESLIAFPSSCMRFFKGSSTIPLPLKWMHRIWPKFHVPETFHVSIVVDLHLVHKVHAQLFYRQNPPSALERLLP